MPLNIQHDTQRKKFWITVPGGEAKLHYKRGPENAYDLTHTLVPKEVEGQGIASALVKTAIEAAKKENVKIIATCTYVKGWFEKHPDQSAMLLTK